MRQAHTCTDPQLHLAGFVARYNRRVGEGRLVICVDGASAFTDIAFPVTALATRAAGAVAIIALGGAIALTAGAVFHCVCCFGSDRQAGEVDRGNAQWVRCSAVFEGA